MLGEGDPAIAHCAKAIAIAPELMAAHNNLGLVYAAQGRDDMAKQEFARASATAAAAYNMGIVHMSRREYRDAVAPFESACHAEARSGRRLRLGARSAATGVQGGLAVRRP